MEGRRGEGGKTVGVKDIHYVCVFVGGGYDRGWYMDVTRNC